MTIAAENGSERRRGRYTLLGEIASGGMATVYFGRLAGEGGFARIVAVKCMHPHLAEDPEFRAMFLDEARLAARVQHPNVVSTLDIGTSDEGMYLVTEYVAGESLAALVRAASARGERVPLSIAVRIAIDTLNGLHAAHVATDEAGAPLAIVHRDVSPQNILVSTDGLARVLDFGIAKAAGRSHTTRDGQLKGKLHYMAPEQFADDGVGPRTDVYAASVVLWELLTGGRLFSGNSDAAIMARVMEGVIAPPSKLAPEVSPELDAIVLRGLARAPADRFGSAAEMAEALESLSIATAGRQLGAWVLHLSGDVLAKRSDLLARIDRTGVDAPNASSAGPITRTSAPPPGASLTEPSPGAVDITSPIATTVAAHTRVLDPRPLVVAREANRVERARPIGSVIALVAIALVSASAAFIVVRGRASRHGDATSEPVMSAPIVDQTTSTSSSPSTTASDPPQPPPAITSSSSTSPSASTSVSLKIPAPRGSATARPRRPGGSAANCNPPYIEDATGIRRVKPQCL